MSRPAGRPRISTGTLDFARTIGYASAQTRQTGTQADEQDA